MLPAAAALLAAAALRGAHEAAPRRGGAARGTAPAPQQSRCWPALAAGGAGGGAEWRASGGVVIRRAEVVKHLARRDLYDVEKRMYAALRGRHFPRLLSADDVCQVLIVEHINPHRVGPDWSHPIDFYRAQAYDIFDQFHRLRIVPRDLFFGKNSALVGSELKVFDFCAYYVEGDSPHAWVHESTHRALPPLRDLGAGFWRHIFLRGLEHAWREAQR